MQATDYKSHPFAMDIKENQSSDIQSLKSV